MKTNKIPTQHQNSVTWITADSLKDENLVLSDVADVIFQMYLIREFETVLLTLAGENCIHGPVHTSVGQEYIAAGAMRALKPTDKIASTHRAHHHYVAKLLSYYAVQGFAPLEHNIPPELQQEITTLMGEVMGLKIGCCGGRGGSMHLHREKIGVLGTSAIVAGGIPMATGAAFAAQRMDREDVVLCFLGDGAVNQGAFHEAVNLAGLWQLPIVYFIENNQYAVGTSITNAAAIEHLAVKAAGYGVQGCVVDAVDPGAIQKAVAKAVEYARIGNGPTIIEAKCYRHFHHAGPLPGSGFGYRSKEEEAQWQAKDAYLQFPQRMIQTKIISESQVNSLKQLAVDAVRQSLETLTKMKNGKRIVPGELWPDISTIEMGIRTDETEFQDVQFREREGFAEFEEISYGDAIAAVTGRTLEKNTHTFVIGEEVANFGGGPYGACKGLPTRYPERIINTPISEAGFSGLAAGAAMQGMCPVVEIMFPDFALVAADQLFNHIGKLRHMYGNTITIPLVVRTRIAIGCGYGGQHSLDPVGLYSLFSGWIISTPANAFDYIGLFNTAITCQSPVLMVEHHSLYPQKSAVPKGNLDYYIPFGQARITREGSDVTILAYSSTVVLSLQTADKLANSGIDAEVIDLRTVDPAHIDYETIGRSLEKTNLLATVEQAPRSMALGPRITTECHQKYFDYFDGPAVNITGLDIPNPVSRVLEQASIPDVNQVVKQIEKSVRRKF